MGLLILGSSLTFSAQGGGWGKEKYLAAAKNPVRPRKNTAEGGGGGNSAVFLQKIEASPAALLVQSRTQQKSFLFLLEEKNRRAQIRKSEENIFVGCSALNDRGGGSGLFLYSLGCGGIPPTPPFRRTLARTDWICDGDKILFLAPPSLRGKG